MPSGSPKRVPEVPSRRGRAGAEREVSRCAGPEGDARLSPDPQVRLLRLPRGERLRRADAARRARPAVASRTTLPWPQQIAVRELASGPNGADERPRRRRGRARRRQPKTSEQIGSAGKAARWRPTGSAAVLAATSRTDTARRAMQLTATIEEARGRGRQRRDRALDQSLRRHWRTCSRTSKRPATLRRPGPSLRFLGEQGRSGVLYDWIADPQHFRPTTRMPRFFGLWDHLKDADGQDDRPRTRRSWSRSRFAACIDVFRFVRGRSAVRAGAAAQRASSTGPMKRRSPAARRSSRPAAAWPATTHKDFPEVAEVPQSGRDRAGAGPVGRGQQVQPRTAIRTGRTGCIAGSRTRRSITPAR